MKLAPDTVTIPNYFELVISTEGEGDVFPANKYHPKNSDITLTATPEDGWIFHHWSGDIADSASNPLSLTLTGNLQITAVFYFPESTRNQLSNKGIEVFPNPIYDGIIHIRLEEQAKPFTIELIDLNGRILNTWQTRNMLRREFSIPAGNLENGLYFIRAISASRTCIKQLIIHK